jgi:hypothetical protein
MSGGIYLIQNDGQLVEMREQQYDSEDLLQKLLADYPNLLAGDQIDSAVPRRWLLVAREVPLASEEDGAGRWSVDHLFIDQDGIPTLVEVKRSSDTRIRREVVGQMLDYAANAVVYWPLEAIRARFEAKCEAQGTYPQQMLGELLSPDADQEQFWQKVKTNLQAGRVRLVFVADVIPPELRRIVEFLNGQMDPAEVLAVELRQYVGQGLKTLVPRVIGRTEKAVQKKTGGTTPAGRLDETTFLEMLRTERGIAEAEAVRRIMDWALDKMPRFAWRKGVNYSTFWPCLDHNNIEYWPVAIKTNGRVEIVFRWLAPRHPFSDETKRRELLSRLHTIPGTNLPADNITGNPSFSLEALTDQASLAQFLHVLDWFVQEVKGATS